MTTETQTLTPQGHIKLQYASPGFYFDTFKGGWRTSQLFTSREVAMQNIDNIVWQVAVVQCDKCKTFSKVFLVDGLVGDCAMCGRTYRISQDDITWRSVRDADMDVGVANAIVERAKRRRG